MNNVEHWKLLTKNPHQQNIIKKTNKTLYIKKTKKQIFIKSFTTSFTTYVFSYKNCILFIDRFFYFCLVGK